MKEKIIKSSMSFFALFMESEQKWVYHIQSLFDTIEIKKYKTEVKPKNR